MTKKDPLLPSNGINGTVGTKRTNYDKKRLTKNYIYILDFVNKMNNLELDLQYSQETKLLNELRKLKSQFKTKVKWDDARKLDDDSFVKEYGEDFLEYTSMDFDLIIDVMITKEKLCASLLERINSSSKVQFAQNEENLTINIKKLSLANPRIQKTMSNQATASTYAKATEYPQGFGYLPTLVHFDPTYFTETKSLTSRLVPSATDICDAPLLQIDGQKISFCSFGERFIISTRYPNGISLLN